MGERNPEPSAPEPLDDLFEPAIGDISEEMLQDLVLAAVNDARAKVEEKLKGSLGGLAGGAGGFPFGAL